MWWLFGSHLAHVCLKLQWVLPKDTPIWFALERPWPHLIGLTLKIDLSKTFPTPTVDYFEFGKSFAFYDLINHSYAAEKALDFADEGLGVSDWDEADANKIAEHLGKSITYLRQLSDKDLLSREYIFFLEAAGSVAPALHGRNQKAFTDGVIEASSEILAMLVELRKTIAQQNLAGSDLRYSASQVIEPHIQSWMDAYQNYFHEVKEDSLVLTLYSIEYKFLSPEVGIWVDPDGTSTIQLGDKATELHSVIGSISNWSDVCINFSDDYCAAEHNSWQPADLNVALETFLQTQKMSESELRALDKSRNPECFRE